jgi:hypothetical protein
VLIEGEQMKFKIPAFVQISLSEIQKVNPEITEEWVLNPENQSKITSMLYSLGMDTSYKISMELNQHRNKFGEVVKTIRWSGEERGGSWLESGYASQEAIDRGLDNNLLNDMYRIRGYVHE